MANGTETTEAPKLPGPVEIPEYYTGFGQEFQTLTTELQSAFGKLQSAETALMKPTMTQEYTKPGILSKILRFIMGGEWGARQLEPYVSTELRESATAASQAAFDAAMEAFQMAEWRVEVMQTLPSYMSDPTYTLETSEDLLQYVPPGVDLTDVDRAWLNQIFGKLQPLSNVLPEDYQGDVLDAQSKILNDILTEPKVELKGVHRLTIDEIAKAFVFGVSELPAGMTEEDVRNLLSEFDLQNEELQSQADWLRERAKEWEIESARMGQIRADSILAQMPELTPLEAAKLWITQPMMATVELMQKWWDTTSRPLSAAIMIHTPAPLSGAIHGAGLGAAGGAMLGAILAPFTGGLSIVAAAGIGAMVGAGTGAALFPRWEDAASIELTKSFEFYVSHGEGSWSAYAKAFNEWDAPWWRKMALDSAYDPLMWIGFGGVTAVGRKLSTAALPRGLKWAGTRIGNLMVAFEQGYVAGMDAIFHVGKEVVAAPIKSAFWLTGAGYTIPKTFTQMARNFARKGMMDFKSVLDRAFPNVRNLRGLTAKDVTNTVEACIQAAIKNPTEGNDLMVRAGANLLEFSYLDDVALSKMIKDIAGDIGIDAARLARMNSMIIDSFSGQGHRITAGKILSELGVVATDDMVSKLAKSIEKFKGGVVRAAGKAYVGDTADEVLMKIFNRLEKTRYGNLHSPITQYMQQAGRSASWHSRVADRILYSSGLVAMERRLVMPVARWQLLFTNFGPYNYLENSMRSFLGGAEVQYPKAYGGVAETTRLFRGIPNAPYELEMFARGEVRLTQAIINPQTGRTAVFKGGRIPFITKNVVIPEKVPALGGKQVGRFINIGDQRYYLGSFQDWYDMWADLVGKQTAYDYQVHFLKALRQADPNTLGQLDEIFEVATRPLLDDIPSLTKRDINDIIRVLKNDAISGGPEALRLHADIDVLEWNRRVVSKELNKTFDKMTDIHMITKNGIRDEVLDGTMFTKGTGSIDDRVNAWIASERELNIASLTSQMDALTQEADAFIKNPPRNLDDFLGDMQNITAQIDAVGERIHDFRRITELRKVRLSPADFDNFEVGSAKMLAEFMETSEESLTKIMNQLMENARGIVEPLPVSGKALVRDAREAGSMSTRLHDLAEKIMATEDWTLSQAVMSWVRHPQNDYLQLIGKTASANAEYISLVQGILAKKYPSGYIRVYRGSGQAGSSIQALKREYINVTAKKSVAKEFGTTKWLLPDNKYADFVDIPTDRILAIPNPGESELIVRSADIQEFLGRIPTKPILSDVQLARLSDLDSITRLRMENMLATRSKIADIEAVIPRTPKGARNDRFWAQQRAAKSTIWDEFDGMNRRLTSMELAARRNFLTSVDKPVYVPDFVPEVVTELTPNHLAYLYGVTGDDLYRGLTRVQRHATVRPREDFILHTKEQAAAYGAKYGKTAEQLGFTDEAIGEVYDQMWRNLGIDPNFLTPDSPTLLQLEEIRQELYRLYQATKIPEADIVKWRKYVNRIADDVGNLDVYKAAEGAPDWWATKETAMTQAREMHALAYPTYDDANIIDETMRAIFPFWNYELFRWKWLPRTFLRTPGVMSGLAKYMNYSDQGYMPVPGTDLQLNPLRGTVFMGGLRSMYLRDFPEFHDSIPGIEFLDYIGRAGFFPGIHVMLPVVGLSSIASGKPLQWGELAPAWVKTSLSGLRALSPQHIGAVLDVIYPDRFRDYMTMMQLASMGYDGDEIWKKKQQGTKLTPEEEKLWLQAVNKVDGIKGVLMNQTGLFRIRPAEFTQIRQEMRLAIEEATGVPIATQEWIDKMYPVTGKRFTDYFHLDVQQQALLYQWESYRRYQGIITPLYPSSWQALDIKISDYYAELERIYEDARYNGIYEDGTLKQQSMTEINRQLIEGTIGPDQWRSARSSMQESLSAAAGALGESPAYIDVPKTFEERAKLLEERGIVTPTQTPDQELLYYYYELAPELKYNWESDRMELDFDTYYAYIDILLESLSPTHRERLLERIQNDWTPMERLYWQFSRDFARPYRNLREVVMNEYSDEHKQLIRRYEVARGAERTELQNVIGPDGKLIAGYQARLREARQRLRILDPTLDAWLYFWGTTDKFMSHESEETYNQLTKQYLVPGMIGGR